MSLDQVDYIRNNFSKALTIMKLNLRHLLARTLRNITRVAFLYRVGVPVLLRVDPFFL